jgi:hypothetical protein
MQRPAEIATFPKPDTSTATNTSARFPLQSAARTSHADSFSPGEAIAPAALLCSKISHAAWRAMRQNFFENFFIF